MTVSKPVPGGKVNRDVDLEFGSTPIKNNSANVASPSRTSLILASYNIRYAVGSPLISSGIMRKLGINFPLNRNEAVLRNVRTAAQLFSEGRLLPRPDILGLQEADKETARAGGVHVARALAAALQMNWVHAPAGIPRGTPPKTRQWWLDFEEPIGMNDSGDTGVALLSHLPLKDVARIDLPWRECAWRPRVAIAATVSIGASDLRIFNAHIDPHPDGEGQLEQLEAVLSLADQHNGPSIVMGDFNTLSTQKSHDTRNLMESRGYSTPFPIGTDTWRGAGLRFHADWIFGRDIKISDWGVARPLGVSDHWPIWAKVEIPVAA